MPKYLEAGPACIISSACDREDKLKSLSQILDNENNRQDKAGIVSQLSQEFDRHLERAEDCAKGNDLGGAEAHRLMANLYMKH